MSKGRVRRLHISWHITWAAFGVVAGAALALAMPVAVFAHGTWLLLAMALLLVVGIRRSSWLVVAALLAGLLIGVWRGASERQALQVYIPFYGQTITLGGIIAEDTNYGPHGDQRLRLRSVQINSQAMPATVWVSTVSSAQLKRGDAVIVRGRLGEGFGTLPASMFRAELVATHPPRPPDVARVVRDWFATSIRRAVPEPQASLGVGYLVGQRSALPEALEQQLRIVGLTHVVVASGYNLTILVGVARRLLAPISKYLATLTGALLIGSFMLVTGFSPSMTRAGLVSGLSLAAWYYGRKMHPLVLLPFAAAVTVLAHPAYVWGDLGWYLSFAAFSGVIVLAPLLHRYFWGRAQPNIARQIIVDTCAAQLMTTPIILFAFGTYSIYALPANVLVLPLVPLAMLGTFFAGAGAAAVPGAAAFFGWPATLLLQCNTAVVSWLAGLPGAQGEVHVLAPLLVLSYIILVAGAYGLWRVTKYRFREDSFDMPGNSR